MPTLRDWEPKHASLLRLFKAESRPTLVTMVLKGVDLKKEDAQEALVGAMYKWADGTKVRTKTAITFFEYVALRMQCPDSVTAFMLMESSFDEFVLLFPDYLQNTARGTNRLDSLSPEPSPIAPIVPTRESEIVLNHLDPGLADMEIFEDVSQPSVREAASQRSMDQRVFYQHPDSAIYWENIVTAQRYPTFDKCKYSLDKLWRDAAFLKDMKTNAPCKIVMLGGGGAFGKDVSTISAILASGQYSQTRPLNYTLLDISPWMLRRSRLRLALNWLQTNWGKKVNVNLVAGDFMKFDGQSRRQRLRNGADNIMWGLTGGTIGNLSEKEFMESLDTVAAPGDTFVLSASVIDNEAKQSDHDQTEIARYMAPSVKALIRNPIRDLIHELNSNIPVDDVLGDLSARHETGVVEGISDVPDSHSMIIMADINDNLFDVFNHTHYLPNSLVKFVEGFNWGHIKTVYPDHFEPDFAQFYFRKM